MKRAWLHHEPIPLATRVWAPDGTESVEPLRQARDGELVVRVERRWDARGLGPDGAVVEVLAAQEKDELVPGDRLAVFASAPCGHCETCRRGHATLCLDSARVLVPSFRCQYLVLPAWIARRGRVRLPVTLSDGAAAAMGARAWVLRALRRLAPDNPLRILVLANGSEAEFLGRLLETRWPDARRVLLGSAGVEGFHASAPDPHSALAALEFPADFVLALRDLDGAELSPVVAPGARLALARGAALTTPGALWDREVLAASATSAVVEDMEAWRRWFPAFSERWGDLDS
jgi:hypothetical protein